MRIIGSTRVALGAVLLARPSVVPRVTRSRPAREVRIVTRILGARYLVQGALDLAVPHDPRLDAAAEILHAASMMPFARRGRPHARAALTSAGLAAALAVAQMAVQVGAGGGAGVTARGKAKTP